MTAFGTLLVSKTNRVEENISSNRNYTKDWMDTGENHDDGKSDNDGKEKKQICKRKLPQQIQHGRTKKKSKV